MILAHHNNASIPNRHGHGGGGGGGAFTTTTITGKFDHEINRSGGAPHERIDVSVNGDHYEADINTYSNTNADGSHGGSAVEVAIQRAQVASLPAEGVQQNTNFSYNDHNLKESDFKPTPQADLEKQLGDLAKGSSEITLQGQTYSDGGKHGIHDTHMNSGEIGNNPNHDNHDGVLKFYTKESNGQFEEDTVYLKFQSQRLGGSSNGSAGASLLSFDQGNIHQ
jgi:hypothetical protein